MESCIGFFDLSSCPTSTIRFGWNPRLSAWFFCRSSETVIFYIFVPVNCQFAFHSFWGDAIEQYPVFPLPVPCCHIDYILHRISLSQFQSVLIADLRFRINFRSLFLRTNYVRLLTESYPPAVAAGNFCNISAPRINFRLHNYYISMIYPPVDWTLWTLILSVSSMTSLSSAWNINVRAGY